MKKKHFFDSPKNVKRFLVGFYTVLLALIIIELFIHKHTYFIWEEHSSFYATYGFVACVVLVLVAKYVLRPLVKRKENYYE